jgi:hypothetical protein
VLFVRNAIFMFVCLNKLVMYVVSLPVYVKVVHFCVCVCVFCCCFLGLGWRGLCGVTGKPLLCRMFWIVFSSCRCSVGCRLYVCSLL